MPFPLFRTPAFRTVEPLPQGKLVVLQGCERTPQIDRSKAFLAALEQPLGERQL